MFGCNRRLQKFSPSVCIQSFRANACVTALLSFLDPLSPTYPASTSESSSFVTDPNRLWSPNPAGDATTPKPSSPHFIGRGLNENLIPIYCPILAAVVVGLLAYVIFKR